MKIASAMLNGKRVIAVGRDGDDQWQILDFERHPSTRSVVSLMKNIVNAFEDLDFSAVVHGDQLEFLCPIPRPGKVICVGKNYVDHAKEMGGAVPEIPVIFNKLPSSLVGPNRNVVLPSISQKVDYEGELVAVIGKSGRHIKRSDALGYVFGYCAGNDVTARDWQKGRPGGQWLLGKTFDTFGPLGPYIVTADEVGDPHRLDIEFRLNGKVMQSGNTADLIFPIDELISHVSNFFTLEAGDLLFTGTPAGVGAGRNPEVYLKPGDRMEVTIAKIGTLVNDVVSSSLKPVA